MSDFELLSSMRYDPLLSQTPDEGLEHAGWNYKHASPCYVLDFHRDRLLKAAHHWQWQPAISRLEGEGGLSALKHFVSETVAQSVAQPLRLSIRMNRDGVLSCEKFSTAPTSLKNLFPMRLPPPSAVSAAGDPERQPEYILLVDQVGIDRSEYTHFKTTKRDAYNDARNRSQISPADLKEVLVHRNDGEVMEGTITTPYFWRNDRWVTPPVSSDFSHEAGSGGQDGVSRRWALESGIATEEVVKIDSLVHGEECWISNGVRGFIGAKISLMR